MTDKNAIYEKYSTVIGEACFLTPQDTGAVRTALRLAINDATEAVKVEGHKYENGQLKYLKNFVEKRLGRTVESLMLDITIVQEWERLDAEGVEKDNRLATLNALLAEADAEIKALKAPAPLAKANGNGTITNGNGLGQLTLEDLTGRTVATVRKPPRNGTRRHVTAKTSAELIHLRSEVVSCLKIQAKELRKTPTRKEFARRWSYLPVPQTIVNHLGGTWNDLVMEASLTPIKQPWLAAENFPPTA
jgi:hypothetical protein